MKRLKLHLRDLHQVFDRGVFVRHLAEPFVSFDAQRHDAPNVRAFMEARDFDIVGVRRNGAVVGHVCRADLRDGALEQYVRPFDEQLLLEDLSPMLKVLELLAKFPQVFVIVRGEVAGIITKGDLQKVPVRMWLFGVLSLLEMQFLRLIRAAYPRDSWKGLITEKRFAKAEELLQDRQKRNEAIDVADCLQFADKRDIVLNIDSLWHELRFPSRSEGKEFLKELEHLRNDLAHAQDIITGRWPRLVEFAQRAEELLAACENWKPKAAG